MPVGFPKKQNDRNKPGSQFRTHQHDHAQRKDKQDRLTWAKYIEAALWLRNDGNIYVGGFCPLCIEGANNQTGLLDIIQGGSSLLNPRGLD